MSERVAARLVLSGVVVTWFVTGFPDPGTFDGLPAVPLEPALGQHKPRMAGLFDEGWDMFSHSHRA